MFRGFITIVEHFVFAKQKNRLFWFLVFRCVFFVKFTTSHNDVTQYHCETIKANFNGYLNYLSYMSKIKPPTRYFCEFYEHFKLGMFQIEWNFKNLKFWKTRSSQFRKTEINNSRSKMANEEDNFAIFIAMIDTYSVWKVLINLANQKIRRNSILTKSFLDGILTIFWMELLPYFVCIFLV